MVDRVLACIDKFGEVGVLIPELRRLLDRLARQEVAGLLAGIAPLARHRGKANQRALVDLGGRRGHLGRGGAIQPVEGLRSIGRRQHDRHEIRLRRRAGIAGELGTPEIEHTLRGTALAGIDQHRADFLRIRQERADAGRRIRGR